MKSSFFPTLMAAALLVLAACDSNPNEMVGESNPAVREMLKIGRLICGGHLPLAIVEKKFQNNIKSFRLQTVQNHDWNDVVAAMNNSELAGTFILSPLAMNLIHEGFPGKIVLVADRNGNGFILSKDIPSIEALKARKTILAVPHVYSQHSVLLHMILQQHGVPEENVTIVGMPPRSMVNSLRNGEIDGFMVGEPEGNKSVSLGIGWLAAMSPQIWRDHMDHVFLVTDQFIKEKPAQLQELINQLVRGGKFIENYPSEAAIMGEDYTGSAAEIFEEVLINPDHWISFTNMVADEQDIQDMATQLVEMKLWERVPENITSGYLDMSFAENAENFLRRKD